MPEPKKRTYAADTQANLKVHLVSKQPAVVRQPADSPHAAQTGDLPRQEVVNRLINFLKGL